MISNELIAERTLTTNTNQSRHAKFYACLFVAGFFTFILHEAAHWVVGTALGYEMQMRLNAVTAATAVLPSHKAMIDGVGPLVTIFQALVAFAFVTHYRAKTVFVLLYMAAFMRLLATVISFFNPNDEARLSVYFGLGTWTLPLVVSFSLLLLVWNASRRLQLSWKEHLFCYLIASVSVSVVVGIDRFIF